MPSHFVSHLAIVRDLSRRSGLFPSRARTLAPRPLTPTLYMSVFGACQRMISRYDPLAMTVLYPQQQHMRHYLNSLRREPAISSLVEPITPTHSSSPNFSTLVGSVLQHVLPCLQPGHG